MKYEYNGTIYNLDNYLAVRKMGKMIIGGVEKWAAILVKSTKGSIPLNENNVVIYFDYECLYEKFIYDAKVVEREEALAQTPKDYNFVATLERA